MTEFGLLVWYWNICTGSSNRKHTYTQTHNYDVEVSHLFRTPALSTMFHIINVSGRLMHPAVRRHDTVFPIAATSLWNSLPSHVTAAPSLSIFCCRLKSYLFLLSYRASWLFFHLYSAPAVTRHFGHHNQSNNQSINQFIDWLHYSIVLILSK